MIKKKVLVLSVIIGIFTCLLFIPIHVEATIVEGSEEITPELKSFIEILDFHLDIVLHNTTFEFKIEGKNYLFSAEDVRAKVIDDEGADGKNKIFVQLHMENCIVKSEDFDVSIDYLKVHLKMHVIENYIYYVVTGSTEVPLYILIQNAFANRGKNK